MASMSLQSQSDNLAVCAMVSSANNLCASKDDITILIAAKCRVVGSSPRVGLIDQHSHCRRLIIPQKKFLPSFSVIRMGSCGTFVL